MRKKTIEDYVEIIYDIQEQKGQVHTNDIANALEINPASVTEIFRKLHAEGYIHYQKYVGATLTKEGKRIAIKTKKKHETLKDFLIILGVNKTIANEDACKIEHVVNPKTMSRLSKFVEFVNESKERALWLEHFDYYYSTGKFISCNPDDTVSCPIHKKKKKRN